MNQKALLRWLLADRSFRESLALTEHLLHQVTDMASPLGIASFSGIVVSYCRPFMEANGLGRLPGKMERFSDVKRGDELQTTHNEMMEARNKMVAHYDRLFIETKFKTETPEYSFAEISVRLDASGTTTISTPPTVYFPAEDLKNVRRLCRTQILRCSFELSDFGARLMKEKGVGEHVFKVGDAAISPIK